ncbi:MAG: hypothetical protein ACI4F9_10715 [Lachnospiraceae bacterium]
MDVTWVLDLRNKIDCFVENVSLKSLANLESYLDTKVDGLLLSTFSIMRVGNE